MKLKRFIARTVAGITPSRTACDFVKNSLKPVSLEEVVFLYGQTAFIILFEKRGG